MPHTALLVTLFFAGATVLATIAADRASPAPAATASVTCTVLGCPPADLKGDGLFSMDQSNFTDTLTCLWCFPLQSIVEGDYNLTTSLLISGNPALGSSSG